MDPINRAIRLMRLNRPRYHTNFNAFVLAQRKIDDRFGRRQVRAPCTCYGSMFSCTCPYWETETEEEMLARYKREGIIKY